MSVKPLALLSVTDKTGLVALAKGLSRLGYELLSTGGTARLLREQGVPVTDVASYTGSPEILDGRVKTLHPMIHGGILYDRSQASHEQTAKAHGIRAIDLVVVNLYAFAAEAVAKKLAPSEAAEHIDIGGPTMLRAAAKNWQHTYSVSDPADYPAVLAAVEAKDAQASAALRRQLAAKTFATVSRYDAEIAAYLAPEAKGPSADLAPALALELTQVQSLRYGENPHQRAALYRDQHLPAHGFGALELLSGKELSYNNILDLDAATALVAEFSTPAVVIVKHTNPCGVATAQAGDRSIASIYAQALACDPKSAFGGIIAVNRTVDGEAAEALTQLFTECVAAPDFSPQALAIFKQKPNLRVLRTPLSASKSTTELPQKVLRTVQGAVLVQDQDCGKATPEHWQTVTKRPLTPALTADLAFAMLVAKHVKSNAIVFAKDGVTIAIGAGQMSRIDAANTAVAKAQEAGRSLHGSVLASDAFFPFRDTVDFAAGHGVQAVVQPGGSRRDAESVAAADEHALAMVFTGQRHFRH